MVLVETIFSTDPHVARSILENSQYQIAADAARVVDLVCEGFKCTQFLPRGRSRADEGNVKTSGFVSATGSPLVAVDASRFTWISESQEPQ